MSPVYEIEPQKSWLPELLGALGLPPEAEKLLREAVLLRVSLDLATRNLVVTFQEKPALSPEVEAAVSACLKEKVPGVDTVTLLGGPALNRPDLAGLIATDWAGLKESMKSGIGVLAGYLSLSRPKVEGENLVVELPPGPLIEEFSKRKAGEALALLVEGRTGRRPQVQFKPAADLAPPSFSAPVSAPAAPATAGPSREEDPSGAGWKTVWGQGVVSRITPISEAVTERRRVAFEGELFQFDIRPAGPRRLAIMGITDYKASVRAKLMEDRRGPGGDKAFDVLATQLKARTWVRLEGSLLRDERYEKGDLVLNVESIAKGKKPVRPDTALRKRVELHAHSRMSRMDGMTRIEDYVERAAAWGHPALAVTDHGIVQSFPEIYQAAKKRKIKVIYGMEGYLVDEFRPEKSAGRPWHVIVLAKNKTGLKNLYRLVSLSHLKYFYRHPQMPRELLARHREGLILGSACEQGEVLKAMLNGATDEEMLKKIEFYDYLEVQPRANNRFMIDDGTLPNEEAVADLFRRLVRLARQAGKPVCATSDFHFLDPEDEIHRAVIHSAMGYSGVERSSPLYFKSTNEMLDEFSYMGAEEAEKVVVDGPQWVASQVEEMSPIPETFCPAEVPGAEAEIEAMARKKALELYGDPLPAEVDAQLSKELKTIVGNRYASLFWIASKLVERSKSRGYVVGSRGSVGSSLVATLCGVTEVNPLAPHYHCPDCRKVEFSTAAPAGVDLPPKNCPLCSKAMLQDGFDIPFEVFLGFQGEKVPDIDLNFSGEFQAEAHRYVEELFGSDHTFRAGTISTMQSRLAYGFVKKYLEAVGANPPGAEVDRLVAGCEGIKKTTGQHPGGIIIVPKDMEIYDFTPVQRPADDAESGTVTTHFDHDSMHDTLVKIDILGHDNPTSIRHLSDLTGADANAIPLNDPKVLSIFSGLEALGFKDHSHDWKVGTLGVPEFGTPFVMQMLEKTKPNTFHELVGICGLAHGTMVWRGNAEELVDKRIADLSTVISCRDDIMLYLIKKGVPGEKAFKIMEDVRKGKGLKPEQEALMKEKAIPNWYVNSCKKISYLFPKAHAVAYVLMAFKIAWFKVFHPLAFYADYFSNNLHAVNANDFCNKTAGIRQRLREIAAKEKEEKLTAKDEDQRNILQVALEMQLRGFDCQRVDLYKSDESKFKISNGKLLPPLASLPGIAGKAAQAIAAERVQGPFKSLEDLSIRCGANKLVLEALSNHGSLADLPQTNQVNLF